MCIFVGRVISVKKTRILVAPLENQRQLIVYENKVVNHGSAKNAMILPVPNAGRIELVDLSSYPGGDVFADCEQLIPKQAVHTGGWGAGAGFGFSSATTTLEVVRVGGYLCSIVPTLADFARLSQGVFVVPDNIAEILTTNYGAGFAFVVCVFDKTVAHHPIAYTSSRLPSGALFIPTRHAHGGETTALLTPTIHSNVQCDACGRAPITGIRWKCVDCPNFDMCNDCFPGKHNPRHGFFRLPLTIEEHSVGTQLQQGGFFHHRHEDDGDKFDHSIYLANCVIVADSSRYTTLTAGYADTNGTVKVGRFVPTLGPIRSMSKVVIEGAFPNNDYRAVPTDF